MQRLLGEHWPGCILSSQARSFQSPCHLARRISSSASARDCQLSSLATKATQQYRSHHWRQRAEPESKDLPGADQPKASSGKESGNSAAQSQEFDLLPLEELQQASEGATEGPIDSASPVSSNQNVESEGSKADPLNKALSFAALQWSRLVDLFSRFLARLVAILSWIPAIARHRKLAKLKAELHGDPLAPDK